MTDVTIEPKQEKKFDSEAFAMNIARAMESGGRALAAYLKPRESGEVKDKSSEEFAEVVKTLTSVAEYWLSDNERASDLQTKMAKGYLDLWGSAMRRLAGEDAMPAIAPSPRDKRFADPEWKKNQFFDFMMQAYLLTVQWSQDLVRNAEGLDPHTRKKAEFYVQQITNAILAVELRADQSGSAARDGLLLRHQSGARHDHAGGRYRGRPRHVADPAVRPQQSCGRRQHGDDTRQGDLSERPDAADPVRSRARRACCGRRS